MPPPPDVSGYRLPEAEAARIFETEILPAEFPADVNPPAADHPLAVLVVGQTGAGKTLLAPTILEQIASKQPAHFIADTYKTYHPEYTKLMLTSPNLASPATGYDARKWLAMAAKEAVKRKRNVLLESACRHPDDFCELAEIFRQAGYFVWVFVLAVPEPLSRIGVLTRFYEKRPEGQSRGLPVRLTPVKVHNDSYAGLLHAAKFLDENKTFIHAMVVRRGNLIVDGVDSVEVKLERERRRPLNKEEMQTALDDIQRLSTHEDTAEQLTQIRELLKPLIGGSASTDEFPALRSLDSLGKWMES